MNYHDSLTNSLLPCPCLLPLSYIILIFFRIRKYTLVADIKQAFVQFCLHGERRDFVGFFMV